MRKTKKIKVVGIYAWVIGGVVKYIGHSKDMYNSRKSNHLSKLRHTKHTKKMQALWDEVGDESKWEFVKIEECLVHDLLVREKHWKNFHQDTICNTNNINKTKKSFRTGYKAIKQRETFSQMFSGTKNPNCHNEIETVIAIKYLLENTNIRGREIAKLFGVNDEYVSKIKLKIRWKDIEVPDGYEFQPEQKIETVSTAMESISEENIYPEFIIPQIQIDKPVETFVQV